MDIEAFSPLPSPGDRRVAVRVTRDAERQLRGGHPWLFDGSVISVSHTGSAGDLAVVFDRDRRFVAVGLWDPASPICLRILQANDPTPIDEEFWTATVQRAAARRAPLLADGTTTGYRLLHGENDGVGGLVADVYGATLVVKLYSSAWFSHLRDVVPVLVAAARADRVVIRLSRHVQSGDTHGIDDGDIVVGPPLDGSVEFLEHGLVFGADVVRGQKTGHFLDQRHNRRRVGRLSRGARVLDVFSATGGFGVHAAAGGARDVTSVDQSRHALARAAANLDRNRDLPAVAACRHRGVRGDAFEVMAGLGDRRGRYDVVVVDPPSFASNRGDRHRALAAYHRLTVLASALVAPGGVLVQASCSSRIGTGELLATVRSAIATTGRDADELAVTGHDVDHPVGFPEGAYLDAVFVGLR